MLKVSEIIRCTNGKLVQGSSSLVINGVSIDTRTIKKGNLFVAILGPNHDAHHFLSDAVKSKSKALLVSKDVSFPKGVTVVKVADTTIALGLIAKYYRSKFKIPFIAVTGSAGKTTTKDLIADVLSSKFNVLKNYKNLNNQFGVPLTLFNLNKKHDIAVIEVGTNRKGDINWLGSIVAPSIAVLTNVGESHLEELKTVKGVYREKIQLLNYLPKNGKVIFNNDDQLLKELSLRKGLNKISYSIFSKADYKVENIISDDGILKFETKGQLFSIHSIAQHSVYNALPAIIIARIFNISWQRIAKKIKDFDSGYGRQKIIKTPRATIIDDTYNSNPVSLRSAIDSLISIKGQGKKFLILGDMLELGTESVKLHREIGKYLVGKYVDYVFTFGKYSKNITDFLKDKSTIKIKHYTNIDNLNNKLKKVYQQSDIILVKGSRGMKMERVVDFLIKR